MAEGMPSGSHLSKQDIYEMRREVEQLRSFMVGMQSDASQTTSGST